MPRGVRKSRSSDTKEKPVTKKKNKSEVDINDDASDDDNANEGRGNGIADAEAEAGDGLPTVPTSTQAIKKVFLVSKKISTNWDNFQEFRIKHPKTGNTSLFLINTAPDNKDITKMNLTFEVLTMEQETRSWFVNDWVISDGNLYVSTPVDPLFLMLPILAKSTKAQPLEDILQESGLPKTVVDVFGKQLSHKQIENICVKKEIDDIVAFKYCEEKTISWLSAKTQKVSNLLFSKGISQAESSISSNFVKSTTESVSEQDCLRYASEIVGEYINENLKLMLLEKLGLPVIQDKGVKRKNLADEDTSQKKVKYSEDSTVTPKEDYGSANNSNTPNKNVKVSAKSKELQKAAQGTHSLLKFFTPKSK